MAGKVQLMTAAKKVKRERDRMRGAADDPSQFAVTPFGRRRRRGTWGVIVTVAILVYGHAADALRRTFGWTRRTR